MITNKSIQAMVFLCLLALLFNCENIAGNSDGGEGDSGNGGNAYYSVNYMGNALDVTGVPTDSGQYQTGDAVIVAGIGSMIYENHTFVSWNTSEDSHGTSYQPGDSLTVGNSNITLYAIWEPAGVEGTKLYCYRRDYTDPSVYLKQIIEIDMSTGAQAVITSLELTETYLEDLVYLPSSNSLIGISDLTLVSIHLSDGTYSTTELYSGTGRSYNDLVLDSNGKVYCYRRDYSDPSAYLKQIIEIDRSTGAQTVITSLDLTGTYLEDLVYLSSSDSLIGISDSTLVTINPIDGTYSTTELYSGTGRSYNGLVTN